MVRRKNYGRPTKTIPFNTMTKSTTKNFFKTKTVTADVIFVYALGLAATAVKGGDV